VTAPKGHLRNLRERQAKRRLGVARALRTTPNATNIELAKVFGVDRDTIKEDRQALMNELTREGKTEMELLREELRAKLENLEKEVELHRKDGKLSLGAIDQLVVIARAVMELTGAPRPVTEELEIRTPDVVRFAVQVVGSPRTIPAQVVERKVLTEGNNGENHG
jgi:hypothetical protein